jgi:hypothetical protein
MNNRISLTGLQGPSWKSSRPAPRTRPASADSCCRHPVLSKPKGRTATESPHELLNELRNLDPNDIGNWPPAAKAIVVVLLCIGLLGRGTGLIRATN